MIAAGRRPVHGNNEFMIEQAVSFAVALFVAVIAVLIVRWLIARMPQLIRGALSDPVPFLLATFAVCAYVRDVPEFPPARAWEWTIWWPVALSIGCVVLRPIAARVAGRSAASRAANLTAWTLLWSAASVTLLAVLWPLYEPRIAITVAVAFVLWGFFADAGAARSTRHWRIALLLDGVATLVGCAVVAFAAGFAGAASVAIIAAVLASTHLLTPSRRIGTAALVRPAVLGLSGLLIVAAYVYTEGLTAIPLACFALLLAAPAIGALVERIANIAGGTRPRIRDRWAPLLGVSAQLTALFVAVAWASWEWHQISGEL